MFALQPQPCAVVQVGGWQLNSKTTRSIFHVTRQNLKNSSGFFDINVIVQRLDRVLKLHGEVR